MINGHQLFGKTNSGFTLIEIFVLIAIVFILAAVIFPRYIDFDNQTRLETTLQNMRIVQMAVEAYAIKNSNDYPTQPDDLALKSYFPGGNCNKESPRGGSYPLNPFTHKAEAPLLGQISDVKQSRQINALDLGGPRVAGKIFYNAIIPAEQEKAVGYAIEAADKNGIALTDKSGKTYVLSNL